MIASVFLCLSCNGLGETKQAGLRVTFGERTIEFSGTIDSEETGQALAAAATQVRPDLRIANKGLVVDETAELPPLADLTSLIRELGISTTEGGLLITDDEFRVSGLTDSPVTMTALSIRSEPIKGDRQYVNHICIVPSEDLPDIPVTLASGKQVGPLINFDVAATREEMFELPGVPFEKLAALVAMVTDLRKLQGLPPLEAKPVPEDLTSTQTGTEEPIQMALISSGSLPEKPQQTIQAMPLSPFYQLEEPVLFSRNTVMLQANQDHSISRIAGQLTSEDWNGQPVVIRSISPSTGSAAFNDWLCEKRGEEVKKILTHAGIPEVLLTTETIGSSDTVDLGKVVLLVERKPVVEETETEGTEENSSDVPEAVEAGAETVTQP